jgi:hypothetical protein
VTGDASAAQGGLGRLMICFRTAHGFGAP